MRSDLFNGAAEPRMVDSDAKLSEASKNVILKGERGARVRVVYAPIILPPPQARLCTGSCFQSMA